MDAREAALLHVSLHETAMSLPIFHRETVKWMDMSWQLWKNTQSLLCVQVYVSHLYVPEDTN